MTEDQIIAEAVRLANVELLENAGKGATYSIAFARHYHALKTAQDTQPEQDPALVKAMAVWTEAWAVCDDDETAARVIMKHYGLPVEVVEWAKMIAPICPDSGGVDSGTVARFILAMAGEKQ